MTTKERVRQKIVDAVPEISTRAELEQSGSGKWYMPYNPITLADVLRAIEGKPYGITAKGQFIQFEGLYLTILSEKWNLSLPFDEQSDEVVEFIGKVLGV